MAYDLDRLTYIVKLFHQINDVPGVISKCSKVRSISSKLVNQGLTQLETQLTAVVR